MSEHGMTPVVASEIEAAYAEIGRTVVQTAIRQAQSSGSQADGSVETTVTIRLMFEEETAGMRPVTCCICTIDTEGVWTCKGSCCPTKNPPW